MIKKIVSSILFGTLLSLTTVALAETEYVPPVDRNEPGGKTRSTGSRGSCGNPTSSIPLTLLAPYSHVGQTTSEHPVLAWYVPIADTKQLELSIYEENKDEFDRKLILVQQMRLESKQGIMKVNLPANRPGLKVGNRYLWEVTVMCNPSNRTRDLIARAEITRVAPPSNGNKQHLWYDLLASSFRSGTKLHPSNEFIDLLDSLAEVEGETQNSGLDRSVYFQQISDLYSNNFMPSSR